MQCIVSTSTTSGTTNVVVGGFGTQIKQIGFNDIMKADYVQSIKQETTMQVKTM